MDSTSRPQDQPKTWTVTLEDQERMGWPLGAPTIIKDPESEVTSVVDLRTLDYTVTCAYQKRGAHHKIARCDYYVVAGTRYCKKHQR